MPAGRIRLRCINLVGAELRGPLPAIVIPDRIGPLRSEGLLLAENLKAAVGRIARFVDQAPNDRVNRSSIARVPLAAIFRVPVPVKCVWPMIGPFADVRFSQSSPDQVNQLFFS